MLCYNLSACFLSCFYQISLHSCTAVSLGYHSSPAPESSLKVGKPSVPFIFHTCRLARAPHSISSGGLNKQTSSQLSPSAVLQTLTSSNKYNFSNHFDAAEHETGFLLKLEDTLEAHSNLFSPLLFHDTPR